VRGKGKVRRQGVERTLQTGGRLERGVLSTANIPFGHTILADLGGTPGKKKHKD
jgi:hypothetical protein